MTPLLLAAAGVGVLVGALVVLRSFGSGYRIGRLLAAVPAVPIAEAVQLAASGERRYVRIDGRIDSEAEFEDADHRPLVLRRTTIAWRPAPGRGRWTPFDSRLEAVPFVVREGRDEIAVEGAAIADGLVVVARESVGRARDLEALPAAGVDPESEALLRIEQVSTVEHATVLGVPVRAPDGQPTIGPGLGRPLIVTTLEGDEAMRVLTGGASGKARLVVGLLAAGGILLAAGLLWWLADAVVGGGTAAAFAASPEPSLRPGSDTRSSGGGPGLVGDPLFAILGVVGVALASLLASLAYVRLTSRGEGTARRR